VNSVIAKEIRAAPIELKATARPWQTMNRYKPKLLLPLRSNRSSLLDDVLSIEASAFQMFCHHKSMRASFFSAIAEGIL
jgi:hypothetical protein